MESSPGESGESTTPELHIPRGSSGSGSNLSGEIGSPLPNVTHPYGIIAHHSQYPHVSNLTYGRNSYSPTSSTTALGYNPNNNQLHHPPIQNVKYESSINIQRSGGGGSPSSQLHETQRMDIDKFALTPTQVIRNDQFKYFAIS